MDWNTLPAWCRFAVCYLACCGLLSMLFGAEWALNWWMARTAIHDNVDEHAEKPNPL